MPVRPRSLPLLLTLLLALLVGVLAPGVPPLAVGVVAVGLLHRLAVAHRHHHPAAVQAPVVPAPVVP